MAVPQTLVAFSSQSYDNLTTVILSHGRPMAPHDIPLHYMTGP